MAKHSRQTASSRKVWMIIHLSVDPSFWPFCVLRMLPFMTSDDTSGAWTKIEGARLSCSGTLSTSSLLLRLAYSPKKKREFSVIVCGSMLDSHISNLLELLSTQQNLPHLLQIASFLPDDIELHRVHVMYLSWSTAQNCFDFEHYECIPWLMSLISNMYTRYCNE